MKILITGGNGYIGENVVRKFRDWYGPSIGFGISDYVKGNTRFMLPLAQYLKERDLRKCDAVIHLAATSGIKACEDDIERAFLNNVISAVNVFSLAAKMDIPVIFTSSQAALNPQSSNYAFQKWSVEQYANFINNAYYPYGKIYVIRLANCYGGYKYLEKKNTVMKQFIMAKEEGRKIPVHGDGKQIRDLIHVDDVCAAMDLILQNLPRKKVFDVGTGIGTSIFDLASMFSDDIEYDDESRTVGVDSNIADAKPIRSLGLVDTWKIQDYIKKEQWKYERTRD